MVFSPSRRASTQPRRRAHLSSLGVILTAGLVAACGGGASPAPASPSANPSPSVAASPSPRPSIDVAAAFVGQLASTSSGKLDVAGELTFGSLTGDVTGEMGFRGADSRSSMTIALAGTEQVQESVRLGGEAWTRTSPGPWLVDTTPPTSDSLGEFLATLLEMRDEGVETREGRDLHRLVPAGGPEVSPAVLGIDTETMKDPRVSLEFLAQPDGTPAIMAVDVSWTQDANGSPLPATMALDFEFVDWGESVTITRPVDVWQVHSSRANGYSMAYPGHWTVDASKGEDAYAVDGQGYVYVYSQTLPRGMDTLAFRDELTRQYRRDLGGPPDSDDEARLGGQAARRLVYHFTNEDGTEVALADYVIVTGRTGYEVLMATAAGATEAEDFELFEQFVATFAFLR